MNECLLCLGSNFSPIEYLAHGRELLKHVFSDIIFTDEIQTLPIGLDKQDLFVNQVAYFTTDLSQDEVVVKLKDIEFECGRRLEDKKTETVRIDIDLLIYNGIIIKPIDLNRDYVQLSIKQLPSKLNK